MKALRSGIVHLALLSLSMAYALIRITTASLPFTWQHTLALALLAICWYARVTGRSWSLPFLFGTLVSATFYLAFFVAGDVMFHSAFTQNFSGFHLTIGLHPLFLLLTLQAGWSWRDQMRKWTSPPPSLEEVANAEQGKVELFMRNLNSESSAELEFVARPESARPRSAEGSRADPSAPRDIMMATPLPPKSDAAVTTRILFFGT
jgi:hypothetical protein